MERDLPMESGTPLGVEAWADVASARRALEWVSLETDRIATARFTGANCIRMVDRALGREGVTEEAKRILEQARALLETFDSADVDGRSAILGQIGTVLDPLVPVTELGARRQDLTRVARLSVPDKRDRKKKPKDGKAPEESAAKADSPKTEGDEGAAAPSDDTDGKSAAKNTVSETESVEAKPRERKRRERDPRPPRLPRFALGHEEGTGRSVSVLHAATEPIVSALESVGIGTITELLTRPPVSHVRVRSAILSDDDVEADLGTEDDPVLVRGKLSIRCVRFTAEGGRWEATILDRRAGPIQCRWITGAPRGWAGWTSGAEVAFVGVPELTEEGWHLYEAEPIGIDGRGGGLVPQYGIEGVSDQICRDLVAEALRGTMGRLREPLPKELVDQHRLIGLDEAIRDAHFPSNNTGRGRSRLAFEELLMLQAGIGWRAKTRNKGRGIAHRPLHTTIGDLGTQQHLVLSDSQEYAFSELRRDLCSSHPMVRLLQGEVGTDKHTIALLSALMVVENSAQVMFVLPDAAAAERRYLFSEGMLRGIGIAPLYIPEKPDRGQIDLLKRGAGQVVFGTRALLDAKASWNKLGLVIVEERDSYGTVDPAALVKDGPAPDLLVITDTPIPTSLTLTLFGEYQMSMVHQDSVVQATSESFPVSEREAAYAQAREKLAEGRQAYVLFPVGDNGEDLLGPKDALRFAEALQSDAFKGSQIGVYCSAMSRDDRLRVLADFEARRIDVIVATTYIEEAPIVSNATVMVVEHADKHELSRLHRLRGHVGQGVDTGRFIMVLSESPSEAGSIRVQQAVDIRDGFRIAEIDLSTRGLDAVLGDRADEAPSFRWADPVTDRDLLLRAKEDSHRMVRQDPSMRRWVEFAQAVFERWGAWLGDDFPKPSKPARSGRRGGGGGRRRRRGRRR